MAFIKRNGDKNDCLVAGMVIGDMKQKAYEGTIFYEIPVSMGSKEAGVVQVTVWNRKPGEIEKFDHVLAVGQLKVTQKEDKVYYSLKADFIMKEQSTPVEDDFKDEIAPDNYDDDNLPF